MAILEVEGLGKTFGSTEVLKDISFSLEKGEAVSIIGSSGSGKTTLLNLIGGLYQPTEGTVTVDGVDLGTLREEELTVFRRRRVGFVFQDCSLVPELTVRENILLPLALDGSRPDRAFFTELTGLLGLVEMLDCLPDMLSGGGKQCAAIARALITRPSIILADEPTGSFDAKTSQNVAGLLKMTVDVFHQTLVMITHNLELAQLADRVVRLQDGRIVQ